MVKNLVSVVVPCYNVENKITWMLDSLARQSYRNLELIFVNDGSTDRTEEIIRSYISQYKKLGMQAYIINQENRGLGGAVETGFKVAKGDFLVWPDADDWLTEDSIEIKVQFLLDNPQYSCVTSDVAMFKAENLNVPVRKISDGIKGLDKEDQFEKLLQYDTIFCPGAHMIRMSDMLKANPSRYLYPSRAGQNVQLLMPVTYHMKRAYINKCLYNYVIYPDSLSKKDYETMQRSLESIDESEKIYVKTLNNLQMDKEERNGYLQEIKAVHLRNKFRLACNHMDEKYIRKIYKEIVEKNILTEEVIRLRRWSRLIFLRKIYRKIRRR